MDVKRILRERPDIGSDEHEWITGPELMARWQISAEEVRDLAFADVLTAYREAEPVEWDDAYEIEADVIVPALHFKLMRVKQLEALYANPPSASAGSTITADFVASSSMIYEPTLTSANRRGLHWEEKRQQIRDAVDNVLSQNPVDHFRHETGQYKGRMNGSAIYEIVIDHAFKFFPDKHCPLSNKQVLKVILDHIRHM